jgi:hypothetical protein
LRVPGLRIKGAQVALQVIHIAGNSDKHMPMHDQGRHRGPVALAYVRNHLVPAHRSVLRIQRNDVRVGRHEVKPALVHCHAAVANVISLRRQAVIMPDNMSRARINGPDVVGHREVQNAVNQQGHRFDLRRLISLEGPREGEIAYVLGRDLGEMNVSPAGIVAVIGWPRIRLGVKDLRVLEVLRDERRSQHRQSRYCEHCGKNASFREFHLLTLRTAINS